FPLSHSDHDGYMSKPKNQNRTFHLLQKADILTCYEHCRPLSLGSQSPDLQRLDAHRPARDRLLLHHKKATPRGPLFKEAKEEASGKVPLEAVSKGGRLAA
ncbi:MAG: hypothetical protein ABSD63_13300, partial [Candidatus Korobacteraceae bacterium]